MYLIITSNFTLIMAEFKFKLSELVALRDNMNIRELELENSLKELRISKKKIVSILSEYKGNKDFLIILSKDIFDNLKLHSASTKRNFGWKKVAMQIIKNSNSPLTTSMIYEKAKIQFPIELADRVKAIHGFSAAISYLINERKIEKQNDEKKAYYTLSKK